MFEGDKRVPILIAKGNLLYCCYILLVDHPGEQSFWVVDFKHELVTFVQFLHMNFITI